jgi:hypothetical protein
MFALIVNQTFKGVKRGLSLVSSPREAPPWLMSADARPTMLSRSSIRHPTRRDRLLWALTASSFTPLAFAVPNLRAPT